MILCIGYFRGTLFKFDRLVSNWRVSEASVTLLGVTYWNWRYI